MPSGHAYTSDARIMEDILINITPQETRVAVLTAGVVQELHVERSALRGLVGNIYLGRVARVLPGMQSAFIDIGLERAAFLHVADIWEYRQFTQVKPPPIERLIHEGDTVMVQVVKDPIGTKGARLSTQVSLAGRMLVYLPQDPHIGISQRIEDEAERTQLRETLKRLVPPDEKGGYIIRTSAEDATEQDLTNDLDYLRVLWGRILERRAGSGTPSMLYQELSLAQRVLRDIATEETTTIHVDSRENFQKLEQFATQFVPRVASKLAHYTGERPLFDLYSIDAEIERALGRRVELKSGGYLIIDQTEAMTTIDVNTGGYVGTRNFDDTIYKTNLEASQAIARQLRLRNLGGIIIVDFIDMMNVEHRDAVLTEFKKALSRDRTRMTVERLHAARPGRDDAQAHARVAGAHPVRALPRVPGSRRSEDRAHRVLRDPARHPARGAPVRRDARVPHPGVADRHRPLPRGGITGAGDAVGLHRQARVDAGRVALPPGAVRHRPDVALHSSVPQHQRGGIDHAFGRQAVEALRVTAAMPLATFELAWHAGQIRVLQQQHVAA